MHFRLQLWVALIAFFGVAAVRAQTAPAPVNAPAAAAMPPGQIKVVKVVGEVGYVLNGQKTALHENDSVPQAATVETQDKSSVILVFSNGATMQLGAESNLVIEQFLQDPFPDQIQVATLTEEPTTSHTSLNLTKGELIGNVKHLKHDKGSRFTVNTPAGAAGIRGTTFRIVFKPSGQGLAFAIFSVSTVEGSVVYQNPQGQTQTVNPNANETRARGGSVAVTTGQEVVITVSVETDPKTGQVVVTAPIQVATTTPINPVVRASLVSQATTMATTVEEKGTSFTSSGSTSGGTSSGSSSSSSSTTSTDTTTTDDKGKSDTGGSSGGDSNGGQTSSTQTSGSQSSGSTSSSSSSTSTSSSSGGTSSGSTSTGAASTLTSSIAGGKQINMNPGFLSTPHDLTPGAGS